MGDDHLISLQPGTVIAGRYEVVKCLGQGSMGLVYACRHRELSGHLLAVKVLFPEVAQDKIAAARFQNEIKASYKVSHPNVVRAYEYLRDGDLVAYTMEYVGGGDLAERLARQNDPIPIGQVMRIMAQMCAGVQAIHDAGIVHRDLKPENILLTKEGLVKIADFGIARTDHGPKLTEHGGVVGTIDYVSPEYMLNSQVDWRSDIYALGILGYEMVTGESPFRGDSVYATMTKRLKSDPKLPSSLRTECPKELDRIIMHAMARDPEERYQSAGEIARDIQKLLPDGGASTAISVGAPPSGVYVGPTVTPASPTPRDSIAGDIVGAGAMQQMVRADDRAGGASYGAVGAAIAAPNGGAALRPESGPAMVGPTITASRVLVRESAQYPGVRSHDEPLSPTRELGRSEVVRYGADDEINDPEQLRMEPMLAGKEAVADGWQSGSSPGPTITIQPKGIDDARMRNLNQVVDRMNRSIWIDILTLVVIVLIGVGVGFTLLRIFLPEAVSPKKAPARKLPAHTTRDFYEIP